MKIMVIRNEPPWPLCYGGRLRCFELCRRLAVEHEVLLVAQRPGESADHSFNFECWVAQSDRLFDDDVDLVAEGFVASRVERFFGISMLFCRDVHKAAHHWQPDVMIGMNYQSMSYLSRIQDVPTLCDLQDDDTLHMLLELLHGRAHSFRHGIKGLMGSIAYQRQHAPNIDMIALNARADRRVCRLVTRHPRLEVLPHGVDCSQYAPEPERTEPDRIVFWGGLGFGPNIGAILFFAEQVWPLVRARRPQARWTIMGPGDAPQLEHVKTMAGVEWLGFVEDIRPHVARATVAVVPMRSGAGIKNKIMEAWAMGKPVVCTRRALGDLPGTHRENVWVGRSPQALAEGVCALLDDAAECTRMGAAGRRTAEDHCSWEAAAARLDVMCHELIGQPACATEKPPGIPAGATA